MLIRDLAHAYLFRGDVDHGIELYRQYLKPESEGSGLSKELKDDFAYLRKMGLDAAAIKKAEEMLSR